MSYQSLLRNIKDINIDEIGVVVCDEAHYFVSDSLYNKYTDIQLKK